MKNRSLRAIGLLLRHFILTAFLAVGLKTRSANLVQEFYLPMPEAQLYSALNTVSAGISTAQSSTYSIIVTGNGTVIYYDQWEDGYEKDLGNPTQASTQIWGDGNDAHGIPPGFVHNPLGLPAGTVITLTNTVALPRNPSVLLYDGRDRIAATKALVVTHAGWPVSPGPVFGGAVSVLSTMDYGTNYISPVGQDLTNINLFKYVGLFVMASQNGTVITIDPDGPGLLPATNIVLNQGESFLYNGGIKSGASLNASKPVQAHLMIGHIGNSYAADWFTLYPVQSWSSAYYTPVASAASGSQPAYVYLYNSNPTNLTINYKTVTGAGSFTVPASNGVYQYQMPIGSGASFTSSSGSNFYALCTVAANNSSDSAYNWGFTLLPAGGLTTEADVGWAPGSSDNSVDGNPVWVTPLAATRIYVDYKGDHLGPLTDPNGNRYDTNFDLAPLQSQKIYDPSRDQTAMRVYTLNGTPISAAWGEDADKALPGLPYIDAGTTVLPFPVPVLKKTSIDLTRTNGPTALGDTLLYSVEIDNKGLLPLGNVVVIDLGPTNLAYVANTTTINGTPILDTVGTNNFPLANPGYTIPIILQAGTSIFQYEAKIVGAGSIVNTVNVGGTALYAQNSVSTATNSSAIAFTVANGSPISSYVAGTNVYVQLTDPGANTSSNTIQTMVIVVNDTNTGDFETVPLIETGTNTGIFINTNGLLTSTSAGILGLDGTLHVAVGDALTVNFTDPIYGNSCSNAASITGPKINKILYLAANGTNGVQALNRVNPAASAGYGTNYASVNLGNSSSGVIALDSVTIVSNTASLVVTNAHITSAGANRLMLVGISINRGTGGSTFETPTNVTYAGIPLVQVGGRTNLTTQEAVVYIFALTNPPAGSNNVVVYWNQTQVDGDVIGCATFTGVNQSTPYGAFFSNTNTSTATLTNVSLVVASAPGELVFDTVMLRSINFGTTGSPGPNQTTLWKTYFNSKTAAGSSTQPGAATVTNTWTTGGNNDWTICGISIKPATGVGGTNTTTFTQTPPFVLPFTIASNQVISVTTYITVTNGTVFGNTNITATLQAGGTSFITLSNPVYTQNAGVNSNLVWTGTLSTNVTIPANQVISCVFSNSQSGVTFHINYDSTNQPSQISLPAVNVAGNIIHITSLGVYDAPYPAGNLVNAPVAGSKLYIRVTATDPFGTYDISSVNFAITGPNTNVNINSTLNSPVATTSTNATYEYFWQSGATTGAYNVSATANEGSEGISDVAGTSLTLTFLDLGTPSTTEFTSGNNGTDTNNYVANSTVWMRVTDLNRNTNATTVDLITAIITSSAGGSNTVVFTETGTNTGIFAGFIVTSTNGSSGFVATVGSQLTVIYTDPTNPSDQTSATAIIVPPPGVPGVVINKTIISSANGQALINNLVQFNLQVINTGSTTLTNVALADNFPAASLSFQTASLSPTSTNASSLVWTNIGSLTSGQSTNISVTFNAMTSAAVTNNAVVSSGLTTNNAGVPFTIANPAVTVTKTLLSPTNSPVSISSNVVFRIVVQNTGNTTISMLPMEDTFSGAYLQFVSSTIPPAGSGAGSLLWTNLVGTNALAVNASLTNDITMRVLGAGSPALNNATVDYAVDSNGNAVPASSSTCTNLITAAATISGHVYNDINHSGVFTNADAGLSSVVLSLYTDPSDTGNPGSLVQIVGTDATGYYEFLNLTLGHYVVVQTTLPGYITSAPINGLFAVNVASLTTSVNNNFFQYQPSPALYGNITGRVYYDANGNGTNDFGETNIANVEIDLVQDANTNGLADLGEPIVASTVTDTNGNYFFLNATPGNYVVRQTLLFGYYNTGDSSPPSDNQIPITLSAGLTTTNNNFYERLSPIAVNDTNSGPRNLAVILSPLANAISPNGDALTITNAVTTNGVVIINSGGSNLTYTPASLGFATIAYTISDAHGGNSTAVITVNVTNIPPVAVNDTASTAVNVPVTISALTNDFDTNGDLLVITLVSPTNGTASIVNNTNVLFTPATNFSGTATIGYTVSDSYGGTASAVISVNVSALADLGLGKTAPANVFAASNLTYTISVTNFGPSSASSVVVTDALPVGATFMNASGGGVNSSGVVNWSFGTLANGQVSNVTVTVTAPASGSLTNTASVSSLTSDPNLTNNLTPPVVTGVTPLADIGLGKSGPAGIIFGTNFNYTIAVTNFGPSTAPALTVTDNLPAGIIFVSAVPVAATNASNQVIWTNLGTLAAGATTNLTLTVISTTRGSMTNVARGGSPVLDPNPTNNLTSPVVTAVTNNPPVANPDSYVVSENTTNTFSPLMNDLVQTPGGSLSIIGVSATNGVATVSGTNVIFTPTFNFVGTAIIGYTITDNVGGTNSSVVTVTVTNLPPTANGQSVATVENTAKGITLTGSDPTSLPLTFVIVTGPTNGNLTAINTNTGTVTYTPNSNYLGTDTFTFRVNNGYNLSPVVSVSITMTNISPVANPDSYTMLENSTNTLAPLTNDLLQTPGGTLQIIGVSPTNGTATILNLTNVVFTPSSNFVGTATIGYTITDGIGGTNSSLITVTVLSVADLAVSKSGPANVYAATNFAYTITVTNFGPGTAASLSVTDNLPSSISFVSSSAGATLNGGQLVWTNLGSLAANAVTNLTVTVTAPVTGSSLTNLASGGSPTSDPNPTNNTSLPVITGVTTIANLAIGKTAPSNVSAAASLTYTISVTNNGPSSASSVVVTDALPAGVTFVTASGNFANNSGVVNWVLGNLASGQTSNLTVTVTAPTSGMLTNVASVSSPTTDTNLLDNVTLPVITSVALLADVAVGKSAPAAVFAASNLTYTIAVTNFGPSSASSVVVTDALPAGVTFVSASGGGVANAGVVNWSLGTLANGQVSNVTVTVTAPASGTLTNTANVSSPTSDPNVTNNVTPPVVTSVTPLADLQIVKLAPAAVLASSNLTYTIAVTNFGPSSASSVVVTDALPAAVTFVNASGNGVDNAGVVNWNLGALAAGQSSNVTVTVNAPVNGTLTNLASVSSPTGDTNLLNNFTPPVITVVTPVADLAVGKSGVASGVINTSFIYTISVTNFGPSSAANFSVTDSLPTGIILVGAVPATTTNAANQVIWNNLGVLAANATTNLTLTVQATSRAAFTNLATVGGPTLDTTPTNNTSAPVVTSITNRPPVAVPDSAATARNVAVTIPVLANDSDPDGDVLTIVSVSATNGTASIIGASIIYTPTNAVPGTNIFSYTITDGFGGTNSALITVAVTNRPPVAVNDIAVTPENIAVIITVLANDSDPDGDALTIISVSPTNGTANISGTNIIFTPATNFVGTATAGYLIRDNFGGTNGALITVTITNIPPAANPDSYAVTENTTNSFAVLVNDIVNKPGGSLTLLSAGTTNGVATVSGTNIVFTPAANYRGALTLNYTIIDNVGGTNSSYVSVLVTNISPVANPDSYTVLENSTNTFAPLANDLLQTPGGGLQIIGVSPTNGTATILNLTNVVFTPASNFVGMATIGYTITDGIGGTNSSVITVTVQSVADLAVSKAGPANVYAATNFSYTITVTNLGPGAAASLSVTDNLPAAVVFVSSTTGATLNGSQLVWTNLGSLAASAATNLTVIVTAPVTGISLTNLASGGSPTSDPNPTNNTSLPVITAVTPIADLVIVKTAPASVLATSNVLYNIAVTNFGPSSASGVVVTDTLPAGVTFVNASGSGTNNSGLVSWSLGALAFGQSSNLTVTVTAPASGSLTNIASVSSPTTDTNLLNNVTPPVVTTVGSVADLAIGKTAAATVLAVSNLTYTISVTNFGPSTASSVTVTDSIPNGASFVGASGGGANNSGVVIWSLGNLVNGAVSNVTLMITAPASGTLTNIAMVGSPTGDPNPTNNMTPLVLTTVTPLADLMIAKTGPASVFAASNCSYTISVTNLGPSGASAVVVTDSLPVGVTFVNASGNGSNNAGVVIWNLGALASGQSSNLMVTVTAPASGTLTNIASVSSPTGDTNILNNTTPPVITTVTPLADVNVMKTGPAGIIFGTNFNYTITVSNAGPSTAASLSVTDSLPASLVFVGALPATTTNGSNQVIWNLGNFAAGTGSNLTLTVISTQRGSVTNIATGGSPTPDPVTTNNAAPPVVTTVTNNPPIANPDSYAVTENTTNVFSPLLNDVVLTPGGSLTIIAVSSTNGSVSILNGTNVVFTPTNNFFGTTTVGYTITDNVGGTNSSFISVLVTNIPPVANPDSYAVTENTTNLFAVLVNDLVQTPGGSLTLLSVSTTNGVATVNGTNIMFTPSANYLGMLTLNYSITDGIGGTNNSFVTVLMTNIPPLANPDVYTVAENTTNTFAPLANDSALTPGGVLQIIGVSPTNGVATILNLTNVVFTPSSNFVGTATIGYTITDGIGGTNNSLITVTVTNIPPTALGQSVATTENVALPITLAGSDPAGRPLTFIIVSSPAGGTLTGLNTNTGAVIYTPTNNFTGTDTFTFRVNDGYNNSATATISIAVTPTADLLVAQSGPASGVAGANLVFTVAVTNLGPASATNVVVTNQVASGYTFVSASASGVTNGNLVMWTIPNLPANGATNLTVTLFAVEGGTFTNTASGNSLTPDLNAANNNGSLTNAQVVTTVSALADVAVFKSGNTSVVADGTVNYSILATNFGPSTASNVVVSDHLPAGTTLVNASGNYSVNSGVITWSAATLPGGVATNFTVTLTAPAGGTLTNIASSSAATADPNAGNNDGSSPNSAVITPVTTVADLSIGKSAAASALATSNLVYTISVTNFGPSTASSVTVTDTIPNGASFVSASGGGANNSGVVIWALGNLSSGAVSNVTLTISTPASGSLTNIATVGSPTSDPNLTNNLTPPVFTAVTPVADVAVGKSGPAGATFNTNFSYTISVTNFGPSVASGILVTDSLPAGLVFAGAVPVTTTNAIGQVIWSIGSLAANATTNLTLSVISTARGALTNFASVGAPTFDPSATNNMSPPVVTVVTNIPPVANADSYFIAENSGTNIFTPLVNDVVRNPGGVLQIISVSTTNGAAVISGTNVLFVPGTNYFGSLTLNYSITDNVGGTNSSIVTVTVTNFPPLANPDSYIIGENSGTNMFSPLVNDLVRTPGGTLQIIGVSPTNGTATIAGTNVLFAPNANFFGVATVGYTITDSIGGTNRSLITVNVTNVTPVANSQPVGTSENTPVIITLTGSDPNHLPLTFAIVGNPANGALGLLNTNTGAVTYTPGTNYTGADSFTFRVNNGQTNSAAATVTLSVTPVADLMVVESGPATGLAGSNLIFTVSVTNRGPATANSLVISNQLSSGFTFVSASGAWANSGGLVTWLVSSLPVNGVTNFTVTAFATEGGSFTNIASGASAAQDLNPANNNGSQVNAQSLTVITPVADVAVFKTGGTNVYVGQTVAYVITATNAGPSTATNVVVQDTLPAGAIFQSASGSYSTNSGVVTWSGVTLAPNAVATFNLTLLAPASVTSFLNIASSTSPTLDPNPTNNNGSFSRSRVATTVTPSADLQVLLSGPATSIQGSNFVYSLLVTNVGPSVSSNIVVSDIFPSNLVFVSASSGGIFSNNIITWPKILSLAVGATTNYTITAKGVNAGVFTNLASALAATYDPNSTNNTGVSPASQVQTTVGLAQFNFLAGTPTLNPQTGLYEETVTVTNTGTATVAGFQLLVGGLRSGVSLYNAVGTNNGQPYIQYNFALDPTNSVSLILEFYNLSRLAFTNTLTAVAILPPNTGTTGTNGSTAINRVFLDNRFTPARVVVEFNSVPGVTYVILYSASLTAPVWNVATPAVTANATVTQWYDNGPPETDSLPGTTRYYRIIQY